jgi:acetyltransferase-like isoleucine patch superfamily enzyme
MPGVTIGRNSIIGASAVVIADVPDYSVATGNPAKVIKKYDAEKKQWVKII